MEKDGGGGDGGYGGRGEWRSSEMFRKWRPTRVAGKRTNIPVLLGPAMHQPRGRVVKPSRSSAAHTHSQKNVPESFMKKLMHREGKKRGRKTYFVFDSLNWHLRVMEAVCPWSPHFNRNETFWKLGFWAFSEMMSSFSVFPRGRWWILTTFSPALLYLLYWMADTEWQSNWRMANNGCLRFDCLWHTAHKNCASVATKCNSYNDA